MDYDKDIGLDAGGVRMSKTQSLPSKSRGRNIKQKQYCNKFNKGFKNGLHQKVFKTKCSMVNALALCNSESVSAKKMDENRF